MRIALFTDTFEQTNGIARTLARFLSHCPKVGHTVDIYTYGTEGVEDVIGGSRVYRYSPRLPIRYNPEMSFDVA